MQKGVPERAGKVFPKAPAFSARKSAIAYVNSNCDTPSGRVDIMRAVAARSRSFAPVHSMGQCDNNMPAPSDLAGAHQFEQKVDLFRRYKFCVAMENTIYKDYVSPDGGR